MVNTMSGIAQLFEQVSAFVIAVLVVTISIAIVIFGAGAFKAQLSTIGQSMGVSNETVQAANEALNQAENTGKSASSLLGFGIMILLIMFFSAIIYVLRNGLGKKEQQTV